MPASSSAPVDAGKGMPATTLGEGAAVREGSFWYLSSMLLMKASRSPSRAVALYTPSAGLARSRSACRRGEHVSAHLQLLGLAAQHTQVAQS